MDKYKLKQVVEMCQLYYQEGYNQQQLAKKYGISRSQISRMLSYARDEGIVEIMINNPFKVELMLEQKLQEKFDLQDVVIVETSGVTEELEMIQLAKASSFYIERVMVDGGTIGLMAGKAIQQMVQFVDYLSGKDAHVIPLVGGIGVQGANWHANTNVIKFADNMKLDYYILNAPAIVSSVDMKNKLIEEQGIKEVLKMYEKLQLAVVGIGEITEEATFFQTMNLSRQELDDIECAGAVCSIGNTFLKADGTVVAKGLSERMIGITGECLKNVPLVIAIAAGSHKVEAIIASMLGRWVDVLITDIQTGQQLIDYNMNKGDLSE